LTADLKTIEVAIIDDHAVVHDGIRAMVERDPALSFVGGARSSEDGMALIERTRPDVLLLDMRLGDESGFALCQRLHVSFPEVAILMFSGFCNSELLTQAIRAGASGYVLKDTDTSRLSDVVREFHERGSYFDPGVASDLLVGIVGGGEGSGRKQSPTVTEQDIRILELIAEGATNYDIATELHLSSNTVKFHVTRLLRRFGASRRSELVRLAMERQILP
jgi:DNA-binding NarL/FixJ family response regulator